ncbi:hypothetical protein E2320_011858 [Naja naja]|nr:hypothetical protein E2320_011858 [Naja naja]
MEPRGFHGSNRTGPVLKSQVAPAWHMSTGSNRPTGGRGGSGAVRERKGAGAKPGPPGRALISLTGWAGRVAAAAEKRIGQQSEPAWLQLEWKEGGISWHRDGTLPSTGGPAAESPTQHSLLGSGPRCQSGYPAVTLFGRNSRVVDYHLNLPAATTTDLNYISRIHARIIRTDGEYFLVDSSLTGVYVNDIRIKGRVNLREGDTVTFGHPAGKNLLLGSYTRQPNSPFYFLFERCDCCPGQVQSVHADRRNFPQQLKGPDLVSAGVSPPGNLTLALAGNISPPQMALPGVLPGQAPLANSVAQPGHLAALAPPPDPALSTSSPLTAQKASEQSSFPSSPCPPLSGPCRRASQVLRSASPDYTLPDENSFAATESPPPLESPESDDSISRSSSESAVEWGAPPPHGLPAHEGARSDPEGGCVHPLLPGPTCSEVSEAADCDGSQKAAEASGPRRKRCSLRPSFPRRREAILVAPRLFPAQSL